MSRALGYLGIARRGGNLELGEENAKALVKSGKARLMCLASDASDGAKRRAEGYVFETNVPLTVLPFLKEQISEATGRPGCSMVAFADLGLAASFAAALEEEFGADYAPLAAELAAKRDRAKARKKSAGAKKGDRRN